MSVIQYNRIDPAIEARVQELLKQMTLAEKVGQLVQDAAFAPVDWSEVMRQMKLAEERGESFAFPHELRAEFEGIVRAGATGTINSGDLEITNRLQRVAVEESRLGIPLLVGLDVIHGFRTVFPIPFAEACTWNPALLERAARVAAEEASAAGVNWIFAPMVDIARDPRWGRIAEGAGEDPFPLLCGRPLVASHIADRVTALLVAWHGGIRTGQAVADILFGTANPSGKLTASWPRTEGQIPVYYAHKNTGRPAESSGTKQFFEPFRSTYLDEPNDPLFPFGFGLSYTSFTYENLTVETPVIKPDGTCVVSVTVKNSGKLAGTEVVQLYVRDLVGSVTSPVKELKGFQRVELQPGETRRVRFEISASDLGFIGPDMLYRVEPGAFKVWIGPDSTGGLEGDFEIQHESISPKHCT